MSNQNTIISVWEEDTQTNTNPFTKIPTIDEVYKAHSDVPEIKELKDKLIDSKVLVSIFGKDDLDFTLDRIEIEIIKPVKYSGNQSSALYSITFRHSKLPVPFEFYKLPATIYNTIEFHNWVVGISRKLPVMNIQIAFYPYSFLFLKNYVRIETKKILIDWNSTDVPLS